MCSLNSSYDDNKEENIVTDEQNYTSQDISEQNTSLKEYDGFEYKETENEKTSNEPNNNRNKLVNGENDFADENY